MGLILRLIELRGRLTGAIKRDGSTVNVGVGVAGVSGVQIYLPTNGRDGEGEGEMVAMREATPVEVARYAFENSPGYIDYLQSKRLAEYEATTGADHQEFAAAVIGSNSTRNTKRNGNRETE